MPSKNRRVILLGSGAIKIGEAGEFDYSGSQAIKALKEEEREVIVVNPNIATIQTDVDFAHKVYLLPVTPYFVEKVIEKEKPEGILLGFGGQTALNCGVELFEKGVLEKYNVRVLGTSVEAIRRSEDRELFRKTMIENGICIPASMKAESLGEAQTVAHDMVYPVMVRVAYTLGGQGSGVAFDEEELGEIASRGLSNSRIRQILIEEYLEGWKEVEYEVMRDVEDNCIIICNMENMDPMGIHTGESIVIAPSQTLTNDEYHLLREVSFKVVRALGIVGECNVQFALNPHNGEYRAIEVNPRLSRSSALASKATGYPIAYIAAKLALGQTLPGLKNKVTGTTTACFEPSLDYCVIKIPRWDFAKFPGACGRIGTQMQSVGEVMGIGRRFEEALQKASRMLELGHELTDTESLDSDIEYELKNPSHLRLFYIMKALKSGMRLERIHELTKIDRWFLQGMKKIVEMEREIESTPIEENLRKAKALGFSDRRIGLIVGKSEMEIRFMRKRLEILPVVNQIDTMAAEWPAQTNYLYLTYGGSEDDIVFRKKRGGVIILGSGSYKIGSSVEFDWCCVHCALSLKKQGVEEVVIINCNPETVSTDFDMVDKLYFEELTLERVLDIVEKENPQNVVVSVGGQIPNNLAIDLHRNSVNIMGTSAISIDRAENRAIFSSLLKELDIRQPEWKGLAGIEEIKEFSEDIGYPVIIRPSYVLSGMAMKVATDEHSLEQCLREAVRASKDSPVVVSKFIVGAKEVEVDGACDGEHVFIGAIIEHIENAGVHSGDATMCVPSLTLSEEIKETLRKSTRRIAQALEIKGPFNVQYLVKDGEVYVIECNLRASRSMPFVSKITGKNLIGIAVDAMMGNPIKDGEAVLKYWGVKAPQFSFMKIRGSDPSLGVEMSSTGEVACIGDSFPDAFLKAYASCGMHIPRKNGSVLISTQGKNERIFKVAEEFLRIGFTIFTTPHTAHFLEASGTPCVILHDAEGRTPHLADHIINGKLDLIVSIPSDVACKKDEEGESEWECMMRRLAADFGVPLIMNIELAEAFVNALENCGTFGIVSLNEIQGREMENENVAEEI